MKLLAPPPNIAKYKAKQVRTRPLQKLATDLREWLANFPESGVQWMCPWWNIKHVTVRTYTNYVPLAGLHLYSFYFPSRLCRQYGDKQFIVEPIHGFQPGPLTLNFMENFSATWPRRTIRRGLSADGDTTTDDHYKSVDSFTTNRAR